MEREHGVYRYYSDTHFLYNNGSIIERILYEVEILTGMRFCGIWNISIYENSNSTRAIDSLEYENTAILPMSSRKRMILNKTWLTDNRKSSSKNLPESIPIQRFTKFHIHTKRANSCIPIHKFESKTLVVICIILILWVGIIQVATGQQEARNSSLISYERSVGPETCLCGYECPQPDLSRPPENLFLYSHSEWPKASNLKPVLYPQWWVFSRSNYDGTHFPWESHAHDRSARGVREMRESEEVRNLIFAGVVDGYHGWA